MLKLLRNYQSAGKSIFEVLAMSELVKSVQIGSDVNRAIKVSGAAEIIRHVRQIPSVESRIVCSTHSNVSRINYY